ncbi:MAG TPA: putative quinol monooxygenase, partial [Kofleriaceae bacterium]|nr:putative quinol monooxygenase [Kofleriaceae bacterium]
ATPCPPAPQAAVDPTWRPPGAGAGIATQLVTMKIKAEHEQDFLAVAKSVVEKVYAGEPNTLTYTLVKHPTEERTYMWIERYKDQAASDEHGQTPYLQEALKTVRPWLEDAELVRYQQVLP